MQAKIDRTSINSISLIILYLAAIVTANWLVATYGPAMSIVNAFLFIGLNITTRDYLHEAWTGAHLKRNMFLLIAAGSILSVFFNAGWIAFASFVAFAASETADAIVYHLLGDYPKWAKINGSNIVSSGIDSVLFPLLAFGWPPLVWVMAGQFAAKVFGGAIWSIIFNVTKFRGYNGIQKLPTDRRPRADKPRRD